MSIECVGMYGVGVYGLYGGVLSVGVWVRIPVERKDLPSFSSGNFVLKLHFLRLDFCYPISKLPFVRSKKPSKSREAYM